MEDTEHREIDRVRRAGELSYLQQRIVPHIAPFHGLSYHADGLVKLCNHTCELPTFLSRDVVVQICMVLPELRRPVRRSVRQKDKHRLQLWVRMSGDHSNCLARESVSGMRHVVALHHMLMDMGSIRHPTVMVVVDHVARSAEQIRCPIAVGVLAHVLAAALRVPVWTTSNPSDVLPVVGAASIGTKELLEAPTCRTVLEVAIA